MKLKRAKAELTVGNTTVSAELFYIVSYDCGDYYVTVFMEEPNTGEVILIEHTCICGPEPKDRLRGVLEHQLRKKIAILSTYATVIIED